MCVCVCVADNNETQHTLYALETKNHGVVYSGRDFNRKNVCKKNSKFANELFTFCS